MIFSGRLFWRLLSLSWEWILFWCLFSMLSQYRPIAFCMLSPWNGLWQQVVLMFKTQLMKVWLHSAVHLWRMISNSWLFWCQVVVLYIHSTGPLPSACCLLKLIFDSRLFWCLGVPDIPDEDWPSSAVCHLHAWGTWNSRFLVCHCCLDFHSNMAVCSRQRVSLFFDRSLSLLNFCLVDFDNFSEAGNFFFKQILFQHELFMQSNILRLIRWEWLLCFDYTFLLIREIMSFSTYSMFWLTQIKMQHFLSSLKTYAIFLTEIGNFPDDLYLWMRYAVLIPWDWQFSWQFCFDRVMSFYTEKDKFSDNFVIWTR